MSNIKHLKLMMLIGIMLITLSNRSVFSQITLSVKNKAMSEVIKEIEKDSDYRFFYNDGLKGLNEPITLAVTNSTIRTVMDQIGEQASVSFIFRDNNQIVLSPKQTQQRKSVQGSVTDELGEPVIGANVMEKGSANGAVTDIDGRFTLEVADNAVLQISYIGYLSQEVPVAGRNTITVSLKEDSQNLSEVVVVGYGVQKKINLTGSVSSIKFDEELANRPITNASQALSGKIPGLWVSQNSGMPGDDGAQLRVRGWGTLNNTEPLIIIDGVEGNFNQINPNDIESITVLKDAASAAIYGSKAANGVILVTTKTGSHNEKTEVNFNTYVGVQTLGRRYDLVTNSAESMELINKALVNETASPLFPESMVNAFRTGTDKYKYPNTDWFKALYENALIHEHNLSIRGGTKKSTAFLSFNYLGHDGMIPNTSSYRYGVRANLDFDVNSWFKVGGRFNYIRRVATQAYDMPRVYEMLRGASSFTAPYTRDGRFGSVETIDENNVLLYDNRNPLIETNNGEEKATTDLATVNVFADVKFTPDLNLNATLSSSGNWRMTDRYNTNIYGYTDSGIETITKNLNREGLDMSRRQTTAVRNNVYTTLNYNKSFLTRHTVGVTAGLQLEDYTSKYIYSRRNEAPKTGLTQVNAGTGGIRGEGNMEGLRMFSYFGRLNYSFADKYLFEANFRADASSRFKKDNRWGYFPGFSAGWRLIEESFIRNLNLFSNLKLRASWGQLGNQYASNSNGETFWPYLTVINQNNDLSYSYAGNFAPGAAVTALVDENITWETTTTLDIGMDMGFLNNRLTVEADYFNKVTSDIIVQLPIPRLLGHATAPFENVGKMLNRGVELNVNYDNNSVNRDDFGWNIGMNMAYIYNEITKFRGGKSPDQLYLIREGYSYQTLYGYKTTGIYQTDAEAEQHMHANSYKPKAGNLAFEDVNKDGKLGFEDKQEIGNTVPRLTYGLSAGLRYKGFDVSLLFQGIGKTHVYTQSDYTRMSYEYFTISTKWKDAWSPENPDSNIPGLKFDNSWDQQESSYWVHRIDFLKLKNMQVGYALPQSLISRLKLEKVYVYANAQNVFTLLWHKGYEGLDPERNTFGNGSAFYATPVTFTFGLNINF
ncbi:MAG: TonB-dependent receptor [Tannerellaceae bacterium]|jgi:TonB-linked SusC/RagA family outer membrane protein|nr:TonB-dependent receptor [Tannerellaceae bacterium]